MMIEPIRTMPERFLNIDNKERGWQAWNMRFRSGASLLWSLAIKTAGKGTTGTEKRQKRHAKRPDRVRIRGLISDFENFVFFFLSE